MNQVYVLSSSPMATAKLLSLDQVEHIILTRTKPREYYPPEDAPLELGPTKGCTEAIKCLEMHCKLLKGSTSKEVLEVFHQEVGLRLISYVPFSQDTLIITDSSLAFYKNISSDKSYPSVGVSRSLPI